MFRTRDQRLSERVLGRKGDKCSTEKRVWTGGEHFDVLIRINDAKQNVRPFGATYPVLLKRFDVLWEIDGLKPVLQFLTVEREVEEPLAHFFLSDGAVAPPTASGFHLLVGEDGGAGGAPVDRSEFPSRQTAFHEFREEPLVPFVVPRVVTLERSAPIVREAHALDLSGDGSHVAFGDIVRVAAFRNRSVLGWHAKGIEAHGVEDVKAHQSLESSHCVADRIVSNVPHMHFSRRIRVHFETVEFGAVTVNVGMEEPGVVPLFLPANLVNGGRFC